MLMRSQKAAVRGNSETGNQAFSMHLRFLTIPPFAQTNWRALTGDRKSFLFIALQRSHSRDRSHGLASLTHRAFSFPFVIPSQQRLMFLDLRFDIAESILASGQHVFSIPCGP